MIPGILCLLFVQPSHVVWLTTLINLAIFSFLFKSLLRYHSCCLFFMSLHICELSLTAVIPSLNKREPIEDALRDKAAESRVKSYSVALFFLTQFFLPLLVSILLNVWKSFYSTNSLHFMNNTWASMANSHPPRSAFTLAHTHRSTHNTNTQAHTQPSTSIFMRTLIEVMYYQAL